MFDSFVYKNNFLVVAFVLLASCRTTKNQEAPKSPEILTNSETVNLVNANEAAFEEADIDLADPDKIATNEEEVEVAINDLEFCKDNIYAQYLRNVYLKENRKAKNPESAFKPSTKGKRRRVATRSPYDARDVEALFYARSRLIGETIPYYGAIPVVTNPRVEHWVRYFKNNGRKAFLRWLVRGESVKDVVVPLLKTEGLPPEFIFLSMVESGFSNSAYSRAKATGPWQFMPGTAKLYGLKMNMWVDERRDPAKSTQAAARLLRDLYQEFGDWYLAMAAYNAGPGRVRSAIRRAGTTDFWALADSPYLPVETKNYVPKVLAALMLSSNPAGHGFEVVGDPLDVLPVTLVDMPKAASIQDIASKLKIPERLVRHWNPELVNAITPPPKNGTPYRLRVSQELSSKWSEVADDVAYVDVKDVLTHKIRKGETIGSIATKYRVQVKNIFQYNPGLKSSRLKVGAELVVPTAEELPKQKSSRSIRGRKTVQAG